MCMGKRVFVATLSGLLFGFICLGLATGWGAHKLPWPAAIEIITSRTLIGLAIGISALCLGHWTIHGLVMGLLFSVPLAASSFMAPDNPKFSHIAMAISTVVLGMIYGLLIELITSVVFKARQAHAAACAKPASPVDTSL
jgi:hypothetical protein